MEERRFLAVGNPFQNLDSSCAVAPLHTLGLVHPPFQEEGLEGHRRNAGFWPSGALCSTSALTVLSARCMQVVIGMRKPLVIDFARHGKR